MSSDVYAYAIRQKSTGWFLPMRWRSARGFSHDEPLENCIPRLFPTKRSVQQALCAWLQGDWKEEWSAGNFDEGPEMIGPAPKHLPHRKAEDMEIVSVRITVECGIDFLPPVVVRARKENSLL